MYLTDEPQLMHLHYPQLRTILFSVTALKPSSKVSGELANRSWPYPHQYIYQYLFEGGIVFGLIPVYSSLSLTAKVVCTRIKDKSEFALCCTLVCVTLPKLLISTEPWATTSIWMLITYSLIYICKTNPIFISLNQSFCSRRK